MSIIESHWRERECRYEDGIYFGTDEFVELRGAPNAEFYTKARASIATLLDSDPNGWTHCDELCSTSSGEFLIFAGETSWEGAGFVAVEQRVSQRLVWLLHLSNAEKFTEVTFEGPIVRAISEEHPFRYEWRIPIESPHCLNVVQFSES